MTPLYVLMCCTDHDDGMPVGVFSRLDKAQAASQMADAEWCMVMGPESTYWYPMRSGPREYQIRSFLLDETHQ